MDETKVSVRKRKPHRGLSFLICAVFVLLCSAGLVNVANAAINPGIGLAYPCSNCGSSMTQQYKAPTCTTAGGSYWRCGNCSYTEGGGTEPALGHSWDNDCDASCNRCGQTRSASHSYSYTANGETCYGVCSVCGSTTGTGHNKTTTSYGATCTQMSRTVTTCSRCDYESTSYTGTAPLGHIYQDDGNCTTAVKCTRSTNGCGYSIVISAKSSHSYSYACDTSCNNDGCTQTRTASHGNWYYRARQGTNTDDDCVQICGYCDVEYDSDRHSLEYDDNTCTTAPRCKNCETRIGTGYASHLASADDGDCTTAVKCSRVGAGCTQVVTAAKQHTYSAACDTTCNNSGCTAGNRSVSHGNWYYRYADDGEEGCVQYCGYCDVEYSRDRHDWTYDDNSCLTPMVCSKCDRANGTGYTSHLAAADDGNCLTAVKCTRTGAGCTQVVVAAQSKHTYSYSCDPSCNNSGCTAGNRTVSHGSWRYSSIHGNSGGCIWTCGICNGNGEPNSNGAAVQYRDHVLPADDYNCTTARACKNCGFVVTAAFGTHSYDSDAAYECNRTNCNYERPHSTVTVYWNGANDVTSDVVTATAAAGYSMKVPTSPTKDGYTFAGFVHSGGGSYNESTGMLVWGEADATLTAQWIANTTLTIDPVGGTYEGETTIEMGKGKTVTLSSPTREGYTFNGWYHDGGGSFSGSTFTFGDSDATLSAQWKANSSSGTAVLTGVWQFNSSLIPYKTDVGFLSETENRSASVSFMSGGASFGSISWSYNVTSKPGVQKLMTFGGTEAYKTNTVSAPLVTDQWSSSAYQTVDFGTGRQMVSADFYNWFTANASPVYASYTVNHHFQNGIGEFSDIFLRTKELSAQAGTQVTPPFWDAYFSETDDGYKHSDLWKFPSAQTVTVKADGSTVVDYYYYNKYYYIVLDGNGATGGSMPDMKLRINETDTIPAVTYKKTGFTFAGWNTKMDGSGTTYPDCATVGPAWSMTDGARIYLYAQWAEDTKYTVTWVNDGEVLETDTVGAGTTASYDGATPTKAADAQYTYTFAGWDTNGDGEADFTENTTPAVTSDLTCTAVFVKTTKQYTITWINWDGTVLETDKANYGDTPDYNGVTPAKPEDASYTYTFAGWDPSVIPVTGDATYQAVFNSAPKKYTVTLNEGTGIDRVSGGGTYSVGDNVTVTAIVSTGYRWSGWTGYKTSSNITFTFEMPAQNVTLTANATKISGITITWRDWDGEILEVDSNVVYGTTPSYDGETPTRSADAQYTYTFSGWTPAVSAATGDVTYTATYSKVTNKYTVTWKNWDGTVLETDANVAYGSTPVYNGATPTKPETATVTYTFYGWDPVVNAVTGDCTYTAVFLENKKDVVACEHDYVLESETLPTCTTAGTLFYKCSKCDNRKAEEGQPATGHNMQVSNRVEPTCEATGSETTTCQNGCGLTETVTLTALGHAFSAATCTQPEKCTRNGCDATGAPALDHEYTSEIITEPTTTTTGVRRYTCIRGDHTYDETIPMLNSGSVLPNPQRTGYIFEGWFTEPNGQGEKLDYIDLSMSGDLTVYAHWTPIVYSITYKEHTGAVIQTISYTIEDAITLNAAYTRTGYAFTTWLMEGESGNWEVCEYAAGQSFVAGKYGNITLTTQWEPITYDVKYDANGGTGTMANTQHTYDVASALRKNAFEKVGYSFLGWATSAARANAGTVDYADQASVLNLASTQGATVTLYAVWSTCPHDWQVVQTVPPTCLTDGYTDYECSKCGDTKRVVDTGSALGHDFADATCTAPQICTRCGATSGLPLGHDYVGTVTVKPTATTTGIKTYVCSRCGDTYTEVLAAGIWLPTPERPGYIFMGWFTEPDGEGVKIEYILPDDVGDLELHAYWVPIVYTITYMVDGSVYQTVNYTIEDAITLPAFGYTGKTCTWIQAEETGNWEVTGYAEGQSFVAGLYGDVTLTAEWDVSTFTITWKNWDGTILEVDENVPYGSVPVYNGAMPTKTTPAGYTWIFDHWQPSVSPVTGDATYVAQFVSTANTVTITLDPNGGSGGTSSVNATYDADLPEITAPTRQGYIFLGYFSGTPTAPGTMYYDADGSGVRKSDFTSATTLYAQWEPISYQVKYNANGGSGTMSNSIHVYDVAKALDKNTFSRTGYTFAGWAETPDGVVKYSDQESVRNLSYTDDAVVDLYAVWTPNIYTITYKNGIDGTTLSTQTYAPADAFALASAPSRMGYAFDGWKVTTASGSWTINSTYAAAKSFSAGTMYGDVTLTALWTPDSYKITYNENGGSAVADLNYTIETDITLATAPTREGYIFLGWSLASSAGNWNIGLYDAGSNVGAGKYGNIELVAQWRAITYQVKYNANGGVGVMANSNHVYDVAKNLSKNIFTREGYTFVGWATSANGGKVYSDEQAVLNIATSDGAVVELYAVWAPWSYTVIYHGNGSTSGSTPNSTHYRDQAQMLNANGFAKQYTVSFNANGGTCATNSLTAKYNFYGWALTATGAKVYDDQQSVVNLTTVPGSTVNLYAVWTGGTITLPTPTRTGYIFAGWALSVGDTDVVGDGGDTYTATGDVTLYALWTPITYYVRYNANGGAGSMGISTFEYGRTYNLAKNTFTRAGYTFKGWATSANGDKVYNDRQAVSDLATTQGAIVDLYAVWETNTYSIVYDLVGGTAGANAPTQATYDVGFNVSAPTRSGYIFLGWKVTGMDNSTHFYGASSTNYSQTTENTISRTTAVWFKNLTAVADGTVQFTAVWASTDIELTAITLKYYDSNGNLRTITDLNNVPLVSRVYVYHTYTNNSGLTQTVNGYHNGSSGMITYSGTTDFTLAAGASMQVLAGNFVPALGEHTITGYVYLDGKPFGDTSAENDGTNNSKSLTYRVAFDVELVEIYFTDVNGNRLDSDNILVGVQVQVHHVYRNNSAGAISVDIYHNGVKYGSIASMGANSTQDVVAATFTPSAAGTYSVSGAIYRSGMNASTETCETNLANNSELLIYEAVSGPGIDIFDPGADLRMGTDVFTSFTITNDNNTNFTPDNPLMVTVTITAADGTLVKKMTQEAIVPAREEQLVWFRWTVPFKEGPYTIEATIEMADPDSGNGEGYTVVVDEFSYTCDVISSEDVFPPETSYEDSRPSDWAQPAKPSTVKDSAEWTVWEYDYEKKEFKQVTYGISVSPGTAVITPDSPTAYKDGGQWYMKAGYGFFISVSNAHINGAAGCMMPNSRDYTTSQWSYALFPEFKYMTKQSGVDYMATMEYIDGEWVFADHDDYGRKHFTPVWYPDTTAPADAYFVRLVQTEIWTPVGVLTVYGPSTGIYISGDIYDDWYTS